MSSNEEVKTGEREGWHGRWHRRHPHRHGRRHFIKAPFIVAAIFLKALLVMFLWNKLIPDLFHGPELEYLQALGLMILAKLLVGFGFRFGHPHHHGRFRHHFWAHLSPEEREKLREKIRSHCGE